MKGEIIRNYLRSTGKPMGDIADLLGMTRQNLNYHLRKDIVDYRTIIGCMGWSEASGMQHLARYAHLVDDSVKMAVDTLPEINF